MHRRGLPNHIILRPERDFFKGLPDTFPRLDGEPVRIRFLPSLSADRKGVYSHQSRGQPVHASTHIRKREIVLDSDLRHHPKELARILAHEIFHFAWVRMSNRTRASYETMIRAEFAVGARGELGWSAEWRKDLLRTRDAVRPAGPRWREYLCESFCDTAAWIYSGVRRHQEFTLAARYRAKRSKWFQSTFSNSRIPI